MVFTFIAHAVKAKVDTIISFDFDETLAESNHLTKANLEKARKLGYQIKTTKKNQDYVLRPGVFELLDFAKSQGFEMIVFTHNYRDYAVDILEDSGLIKYFSKVKAHEDVIKAYNHDYKTYPYHRNIKYPQKSLLETYTVDLFNGYFVNLFEEMRGNKNVVPFIPCTNCAKYPPLYGARVHIDNASQHVENSLDFVGIEVVDFEALEPEPTNVDGKYKWVEDLKQDILYLKHNGWVELYKSKNGKEPIAEPVLMQP